MSPEDFQYLSMLVKAESGLVITDDKSYLLESRLLPLARKRGFQGLDELVQDARAGNKGLMKDITEAMTTNESFFFRDEGPFELFRERIVPY